VRACNKRACIGLHQHWEKVRVKVYGLKQNLFVCNWLLSIIEEPSTGTRGCSGGGPGPMWWQTPSEDGGGGTSATPSSWFTTDGGGYRSWCRWLNDVSTHNKFQYNIILIWLSYTNYAGHLSKQIVFKNISNFELQTIWRNTCLYKNTFWEPQIWLLMKKTACYQCYENLIFQNSCVLKFMCFKPPHIELIIRINDHPDEASQCVNKSQLRLLVRINKFYQQ